ncbi:MAG: ParB/RepB/Spo0J family partition protein [Thermoanaerobaculia bacterium]
MSEKRKGLGRGLSALISSDEGEGVRSLPLTQIHPNRNQPRSRFDETGLEELAASIRTQGLIQPLIVSPTGKGTYTLVAGERRWRAAQRAGLAVVPVVVRQVKDDRELLELALVENLQRADLNPIEEAEAYRSLAESFGMSQEEIADRVGKARPAVSNTLRLLRLPPEIQDLLRSGELTQGQARPLLAVADTDEQLRLAMRAVREGLTARSMEALAGGEAPERKKRGRRAAKPVEPHAAAAAERLTRALHTKVEIERRGKGGVIRIHFHSEEELIGLFDRLTDQQQEGA